MRALFDAQVHRADSIYQSICARTLWLLRAKREGPRLFCFRPYSSSTFAFLLLSVQKLRLSPTNERSEMLFPRSYFSVARSTRSRLTRHTSPRSRVTRHPLTIILYARAWFSSYGGKSTTKPRGWLPAKPSRQEFRAGECFSPTAEQKSIPLRFTSVAFPSTLSFFRRLLDERSCSLAMYAVKTHSSGAASRVAMIIWKQGKM